ncbi:hypothetical protein ACFQ9X_23455 [Catenulispora yoronensis]
MTLVNRLAQFADAASIGEIAIGAQLADVERVHGETFDMIVSNRRAWPRLLGLGDAELWVCRCRRVNLICLQTWQAEVQLPYADRPGCEAFPGSRLMRT